MWINIRNDYLIIECGEILLEIVRKFNCRKYRECYQKGDSESVLEKCYIIIKMIDKKLIY